MTEVMKPRYEAGDAFFDDYFYDAYKTLDYPLKWIEEGKNYSSDDSYVISHPSWLHDKIPSTPDISIYELFKKTAEHSPDEIAVIFLDKEISYKELNKMIGQYSTLLTSLGVKKGDVVAAILPNSLQHIVAFYGAVKIGAVHSPVNVMYQNDEIDYQLKDSGAKTVFILDLLYSRVEDLKKKGVIDNIIVTSLSVFANEEGIVSETV